jgi:hypothetical protein
LKFSKTHSSCQLVLNQLFDKNLPKLPQYYSIQCSVNCMHEYHVIEGNVHFGLGLGCHFIFI